MVPWFGIPYGPTAAGPSRFVLGVRQGCRIGRSAWSTADPQWSRAWIRPCHRRCRASSCAVSCPSASSAPHTRPQPDVWLARIRTYRRESLSRNVDHVVDASHHGQIPVIVEVAAVTGEVVPGVLAQIGRQVAGVAEPRPSGPTRTYAVRHPHRWGRWTPCVGQTSQISRARRRALLPAPCRGRPRR